MALPTEVYEALRLRKTAKNVMILGLWYDDPQHAVEGYTCPFLGYQK